MKPKTRNLLLIGGAVVGTGAYFWYRERNKQLANAQLAAAQQLPIPGYGVDVPADAYVYTPPTGAAAARMCADGGWIWDDAKQTCVSPNSDPVVIGTPDPQTKPPMVVDPRVMVRPNFAVGGKLTVLTDSTGKPIQPASGGKSGGSGSPSGPIIRRF